MKLTRSSAHPTAQQHKCLATLLWRLQISLCRCFASLWNQLCTSSCRLEKWRSEQQVTPKIGTYLVDARRRLSTVYCCCHSSCPHCDGRHAHHRPATDRPMSGNHHTNRCMKCYNELYLVQLSGLWVHMALSNTTLHFQLHRRSLLWSHCWTDTQFNYSYTQQHTHCSSDKHWVPKKKNKKREGKYFPLPSPHT